MNFDLKRPCKDCPFLRVGAIELHPERVPSIIAGLLSNDRDWFKCHRTAHLRPSTRQSQCVGSMVVLLKADAPSVSMRMAAALDMLDFDALRALYPEVIEPPPAAEAAMPRRVRRRSRQ